MDLINHLIPTFENIHLLGYWLALFFAMIETTIGIGIFIPGSTIILILGTLVAKGNLHLGDLIFFATVGAVLGDNINYYIGRKFGSKIFEKGFWVIKPKHIEKARLFLDTHGSKSIFLGRFIPSIKEVAPLIAGTVKMKRLQFTIWNILGAIGWSLLWILPGYFFAQSLDTAKVWLSRAGFFVLLLAIFLIIFYIIKYFIIKSGKQIFKLIKSLWKSFKLAIQQNTDIQKYVSKHQKFFTFLSNRFDKNKFSGRTLTFLFLTFVYIIFLLGGSMESLIKSEIITFVDIRVVNLMLLFRDSELIKFFMTITVLGSSKTIILITVASTSILLLSKKRTYIIPFLTTIVGSTVFAYLGKMFFHRPRPEFSVYLEKSFSFPSGHATIAVALFGFLSYIIIREYQSWRVKVNIFFTTLLLIILIGFSRIYLGVHYVSDVWEGYLLGALWLIIGISISQYLFSKKTINQVIITTKTKLYSYLIIIFTIFFYIFLAWSFHPTLLIENINLTNSTLDSPLGIFKSEQVKYTETLTGQRQEPISFVILAKNQQDFLAIFNSASWQLADIIDINNTYKLVQAALFKKPYETAPMTPSFWNAKTNDFGFEKANETNNARQRHHARFWKTSYTTADGYNIYVGTSSFDEGIKWGITHRISPDIDTEREKLFIDLKNTELIKYYSKEKNVNPVLGKNFTGDQFFTDGNLYLIKLKSTK
ncbi:MAG: PA-phosphatase [Candidatus Magasanikbacteria bacterium CG10_big_fil_rev_8_21_14_0_10_36_16]|uniref:PA-phosphatase n=1 Tax=Candidatus Magasanikbacteria bacterium CG10_big_fil_rev_8_21_14_0_10_36_16 TaxID=1974645 RepID=A0A2H0TXJ2_9BACT|nr:MAG: PA-phosphatase [Candidatus Magasanikbacteria bacterium CG10_big_fil_rev_8_21_14_0_10_36_16]